MICTIIKNKVIEERTKRKLKSKSTKSKVQNTVQNKIKVYYSNSKYI